MSVQPGDRAPDIDLVHEQDQQWRLSDHRGWPVLLIFHRHLA
jgi:peroxiredoxin